MPSPFTSLPSEVLENIIEHCPVPDLKSLRLTSRYILKLSNKYLFSEVIVWPDEGSYGRYASIVDSAYNPYVHGITFVTRESPDILDSDVVNMLLDNPWEHEDEKLSDDLLSAVDIMGRFPNLEAVTVHFTCEVCKNVGAFRKVRENSTIRKKILQRVLAGLESKVHPTPKLKRLSLKNLQDINDPDVVQSAAFKRVLCRIKELRLQIATDKSPETPEHALDNMELHAFFKELPGTWLANCQSLEKLTIQCDIYWGYFPKVDLRGIELPHLKFLELANFSFSQEWQLDWICGLKSLRTLIMDNCTIFSQGQGHRFDHENFASHSVHQSPVLLFWSNEARWANYFNKLGAQLPLLREFVFGRGIWKQGIDFEKGARLRRKEIQSESYDAETAYRKGLILGLYKQRYKRFDHYGSRPYLDFSWNSSCEMYPGEEEEKDGKALEALKMLIQKRM